MKPPRPANGPTPPESPTMPLGKLLAMIAAVLAAIAPFFPSARMYATQPWGLRGCPPVGGYEWRTREDDPDRLYLYRDGVQIGGYCHRAAHYRPFDATTRSWGDDPIPCPVPVPARAQPAAPVVREPEPIH